MASTTFSVSRGRQTIAARLRACAHTSV
jgi:hypothetical protein